MKRKCCVKIIFYLVLIIVTMSTTSVYSKSMSKNSESVDRILGVKRKQYVTYKLVECIIRLLHYIRLFLKIEKYTDILAIFNDTVI